MPMLGRTLSVIGGLAGCMHTALQAQSGAHGGPRLEVVDSLVLEESESTFVGRVKGVAVSRRGHVFVSDAANWTLHEFDGSGRWLRAYGRRGQGPGEFTSPGPVVLAGDTAVIIDGGTKLQAFDTRTGKLIWEKLVPARMIRALAWNRGSVTFNSVVGRDSSHHTLLASLDVRTGNVRFGVPLFEPLGRNIGIDMTWSTPAFTYFGRDSIALAFNANSDFLYLGTLASTRFDSIHVAAVRRRGRLKPEILHKAETNPRSMTLEEQFQPSVPWVVGQLSSGLFVYGAFDPGITRGRLIGQLYASLVDRRAHRACVDALVPVPSDPAPWATMSGDTLMVLSQDEDARGQPRAILRKMLVRSDGCRWFE